MFHVGQKVCCIDDSAGWFVNSVKPLVLNKAYVIEDCRMVDTWDSGEVLEVKVEGLPYRFSAKRFRPIVDTKKEVSWTIGAPDDSEIWDNRRKIDETTR